LKNALLLVRPHQPFEFSRKPSLRCRAHPVDEQDSIQMVDFMLESASQKSLCFKI
jgi:hypothetical protein